MVTAAGLRADAREGCLRIPELAAVYARVMPVWLEDDDPGLARTMAALDRRLRRGEKMVELMQDACGKVNRILCCFVPRRREESHRAADTPPPPPPSPPPGGPIPEPPVAG
jgi:hypothetical protein